MGMEEEEMSQLVCGSREVGKRGRVRSKHVLLEVVLLARIQHASHICNLLRQV